MSTRSVVVLSFALSLGLNLPGLVALGGVLFEPLGLLVLAALPLVAIWGLPGLFFRGPFPDGFRLTEFGIYPDAPTGWCLLFGFWAVIGVIAAKVLAFARARRDARGEP